MQNQFALLKNKRFFPMFCTQFLGALNDNVTKQAVVLLFAFTAAAQLHVNESLITNLCAVLFIIPFFVLSATAGQMADAIDKAQISRWVKNLEIGITLIASVGFIVHWYYLLLVALSLLGVHSAIFGPVKYAYLPQMLHKDELVSANAFFQSGTSVSILVGMIVGGLLISQGTQSALVLTSMFIVGIALLGRWAAAYIPSTPVSPTKIEWNIFVSTKHVIHSAIHNKTVLYTIIGVSWFWFFGTIITANAPLLAKHYFLAQENMVSIILMLFSVGVSLGSLGCRRFLGNAISLKLMPIGAMGLSLLTLDLFFSLPFLPQAIAANGGHLLNLWQVWHAFIVLFLIGVMGGFYIVPLYAYMQFYAPTNQKAQTVAANNVFNALFMVLAAILSIITLSVLKMPLSVLFLMVCVLNLSITFFCYKKLV